MAKVEVPQLGKPRSFEALDDTVNKVQAALQSLSEVGGTNAEAITAAAADLKAAKESALEAAADAKLAKEMAANAEALAKNSARTVPGLTEDAIRSIPVLHDIRASRDFNGKLDPMAYNILAMSAPERERCDEPTAKLIERVQRLWAGISVVDGYYMAHSPSSAREYQARGGWKSLGAAKEFMELEKRIKAAAMDTAESGGGLQWVPTGVLPNLLPDIRPDFELMGHIPEVALARSPMLLPVQGDHFRANKVAEATASTSQTQMATNNLSTLSLTFTAVGCKSMTVYSTELEDDAIVALATVVPADLATAIRASLDSAGVNGQLTGTADLTTSTFDTGETFVSATDDRHLWDGLRYFGSLTGVSEDLAAGVTVDGLNAIRGGMGKYGKKPSETVWVTGYKGWAKVLGLKDSGGTSVYLTVEKAGASAVNMTGTLGFLLGSPLVVSDYYPENLNAASGVIDGAGSTTSILCFNRMALRLGVVRVTRIESSREQFFQFDQIAYKATFRGQMKPIRTPSSTYKIVGVGVGIAT